MPKVISTIETIAASHDSLLVKSVAATGALYPDNGADTNSLIPSEGRGFTWSWWQRQNTADGAGSEIWYLIVRPNGGGSPIIKIAKIGNANNGEIRATFKGTSGQYQVYWSDFGLNYLINGVGNWYHFVISWNGETSNLEDNLFLYVNGAKIEKSGIYDGLATNLASTTDGELIFFGPTKTSANTTSDLSDANITHMSWWNQQLTDSEVTELYNDGKTFDVSTRHSVTPAAYWQFNSEDITTLTSTQTDIRAIVGPDIHNDHKGTGVYEIAADIHPFSDDTTGETVYRSGKVSISPRVRIREIDNNIQGQYPVIKKTGPRHRKGNIDSCFYDEETIVFREISNLSYPTLSIDGDDFPIVGTGAYSEPEFSTGAIVTTGSLIPGITDNYLLRGHRELASSRFEDALIAKNECIEGSSLLHPFDDSAVFMKNNSYFSSGSDIPGFRSSLRDKTQISFTLDNRQEEFLTRSPKNRNNVLDPSGEFFGKDKTGFVYYNWITKKWDQIGLIDPATGNQRHHDFAVEVNRQTNKFVSGTNNFPNQFYPTPQNDTTYDNKVGSSESWPNAGYPHINSFAPLSTIYHATSSQCLEMKDYISHPFLLEKVTVEIPYEQRRSHIGDSNSNNTSGKSLGQLMHQADYVFFIYRQDRNATQQPIDSALDVSGSNRFLIVSGCMSFYNSKVYDHSLSSYSTNNKPLNTPAFQRDHGITSTGNTVSSTLSGKAFLELTPAVTTRQFNGGARIPSSSFGDNTTNEVNIPQYYWPGGTSYRNFGETQFTGRSFPTQVGTFGGGFDGTAEGNRLFDEYSLTSFDETASKLSNITVFDPRIRSLGGSITKIRSSNLAIIEGEKQTKTPYLLFPEDRLVFGIDNPMALHKDQKMSFSNELTGSFLKLIEGSGFKVTFYGSQIRNKEEFHDTLNQHLTTEAVSEFIGYDESLCRDQFLLASRFEYSGSYIDDHSTGGVGSNVNSLLGTGENVLSGSYQRFIPMITKDRYWDTYTPSIESILTAEGLKKEIFKIEELIPSVKASYRITSNAAAVRFYSIFPFEGKHLDVDSSRSLSENIIFFRLQAENDSTKELLYRDTFSFLGTNQIETTNLAGRNKNTREAAFSFGSGQNGFHKFVDGTVRLHRPVGAKYGLLNFKPQFSKYIYRYDQFGMMSDMLEQGLDGTFYNQEKKTIEDPPVKIDFVVEDENKRDTYIILDKSEIESNTFESSNVSLFATSSIPFIDDGIVRNRSNFNAPDEILELN